MTSEPSARERTVVTPTRMRTHLSPRDGHSVGQSAGPGVGRLRPPPPPWFQDAESLGPPVLFWFSPSPEHHCLGPQWQPPDGPPCPPCPPAARHLHCCWSGGASDAHLIKSQDTCHGSSCHGTQPVLLGHSPGLPGLGSVLTSSLTCRRSVPHPCSAPILNRWSPLTRRPLPR